MFKTTGSRSGRRATVEQSGLVLLEAHDASASANLDFATRNAPGQSGPTFQSDFDEYVIEVINMVPATAAVDLRLRFSTDGGATYDAGANYEYADWIFKATSSFTTLAQSGSGTGATFATNISTSTTNGGVCSTLKLYSPRSTTCYKVIHGATTFYSNDGGFYGVSVAGIYKSASAINAFRVIASSGNITGTVRLYGVRK